MPRLFVVAIAAALLLGSHPSAAQPENAPEFDERSANDTRLFFGPTARSLGHGRGYISVYELIVPFVAVGIGEHLTMAGGVTINPGDERLAYLAPKVTLFERDGYSLATGALGIFPIGSQSDETVGVLYAVGTRNGTPGSVTAGFAYGFADGEFGSRPAFMAGGDFHLTDKTHIITENYIFVGTEDGLLSAGGFRFVSDNLTIDLGLFTFPALFNELGGFPFVPWLGLTYQFGG